MKVYNIYFDIDGEHFQLAKENTAQTNYLFYAEILQIIYSKNSDKFKDIYEFQISSRDFIKNSIKWHKTFCFNDLDKNLILNYAKDKNINIYIKEIIIDSEHTNISKLFDILIDHYKDDQVKTIFESSYLTLNASIGRLNLFSKIDRESYLISDDSIVKINKLIAIYDSLNRKDSIDFEIVSKSIEKQIQIGSYYLKWIQETNPTWSQSITTKKRYIGAGFEIYFNNSPFIKIKFSNCNYIEIITELSNEECCLLTNFNIHEICSEQYEFWVKNVFEKINQWIELNLIENTTRANTRRGQ